MTTNDEQLHIKACLQAIETKLNWGDTSGWSNADFEKLAALIAEDTEVQLSVSTLKRVWGKVTYLNAPSQTTLNTFAMYLGYVDWRTYQQQFRPAPLPSSPSLSTISEVHSTEVHGDTALADSPVNGAAGHLMHTTRGKRKVCCMQPEVYCSRWRSSVSWVLRNFKDDPSKFHFSANKIASEGVPNTAIFHYDASAAHTDSNFIVQTWDIRRKTHVPKDKHEHSAIYYYPGFFRARLIADGEEVQAHNLMISSNGWLCLAENNPVPHYFKKEEYLKADRVEVDSSTLKTYGLSLYPTPPRLRFFNERDLGTLQSDRFVFETKVKSGFSTGSGACQYVDVLIQCKNDIIYIPLAAKTCTGELHLTACGANVYSKHADLTGFGADLSDWVTLRVESSNRHLKFYVNGAMAYQLDFPNEPTGIVGVQYRFEGLGAVKDTWFKDGDALYDFGVGK